MSSCIVCDGLYKYSILNEKILKHIHVEMVQYICIEYVFISYLSTIFMPFNVSKT